MWTSPSRRRLRPTTSRPRRRSSRRMRPSRSRRRRRSTAPLPRRSSSSRRRPRRRTLLLTSLLLLSVLQPVRLCFPLPLSLVRARTDGAPLLQLLSTSPRSRLARPTSSSTTTTRSTAAQGSRRRAPSPKSRSSRSAAGTTTSQTPRARRRLQVRRFVPLVPLSPRVAVTDPLLRPQTPSVPDCPTLSTPPRPERCSTGSPPPLPPFFTPHRTATSADYLAFASLSIPPSSLRRSSSSSSIPYLRIGRPPAPSSSTTRPTARAPFFADLAPAHLAAVTLVAQHTLSLAFSLVPFLRLSWLVVVRSSSSARASASSRFRRTCSPLAGAQRPTGNSALSELVPVS